MANAYNYSNTAQATTLAGNISAGATTVVVAATTGFPGSFPYILAVDYGAATEELVSVTAAAGTSLTVTRAFGGTSAQSHSIGAVVRHVINAQDLIDFRTHEAATSDVHGVTGALVGATSTQTLTNKTLTSPTINSGTYANGGSLAGTFTGAPTLSGNVAFTGSPSFVTASFSGNVTHSSTSSFAGTATHTSGILSSRTNTTDVALAGQISTDTEHRVRIYESGLIEWGPGGAVTRDTNLYRDSANVLKTDDTFQIGAAGTLLLGSTGDVNLYRLGANSLATDDSFTVGGTFSVSGVGQNLYAYKASDTSRTTATTSADPELVVSLSASSVYRIHGQLFFYTTDESTADLSQGFTIPAGATGRWAAFAQGGGSPSTNAGLIRTISQDFATFRSYDAMLDSSGRLSSMFGGLITTTNSGVLAVSWARSGGSGTVTLTANSWLHVVRVG